MSQSTIPETIREKRRLLGLSQHAFVKLFNETEPLELTIDQTALCRYERGTYMPPADKFTKILNMCEKHN